MFESYNYVCYVLVYFVLYVYNCMHKRTIKYLVSYLFCNVLLTDKESNNPSHMIDTLMCVGMLRLVDDMVCVYVQNFITMIIILTQVK